MIRILSEGTIDPDDDDEDETDAHVEMQYFYVEDLLDSTRLVDSVPWESSPRSIRNAVRDGWEETTGEINTLSSSLSQPPPICCWPFPCNI